MASDATRNRSSTRLVAVAAVALLLGACGDDDSDSAFEDLVPDTSDSGAGIEPEGAEEPEEPAGERELQPLTFALPDESEPGAGFERLAATCEATDDYGAYFTFAYPEEWEAAGRSAGGGGSPLGNSVDIRFRTDDGEVEVQMDPDSRRPDGPVLDSSGEPWESFDYESTRGDDTTVITYDPVDTVPVGDQEVEIVVADQSQAPEFLSRTEHKARLETAELPNPAPGDEDGIQPASMVVTILHDAEDVELDADTVPAIIESFAVPECTKEQVIVGREVLLGEDLDGDGDVSGPEDL